MTSPHNVPHEDEGLNVGLHQDNATWVEEARMYSQSARDPSVETLFKIIDGLFGGIRTSAGFHKGRTKWA